MKNISDSPKIRDGQLLHFGSLFFLLLLVWYGWSAIGGPNPIAFMIAIAIPIVHQLFVWLTWRIELQSGVTSKTIGLQGYLILFFLLFAGRFISLIILAWLDRGSLGLEISFLLFLTLTLGVIALYAMYSVVRYFGFARAAGADHFQVNYRKMPLVNEGIFRFTDNGMYVYAFLMFWVIALAFNSLAALLVAVFSHVYIWIHYYSTEKPDMEYLYGSFE